MKLLKEWTSWKYNPNRRKFEIGEMEKLEVDI